MTSDDYKDDHAVIDADMSQAVTLDFAEYVGFLAHYGVKLRKLAAKHENPEATFLKLRAYADKVIADLGDTDH
ncbi:hypothetical protein AB0G73_10760 [Streptomyces sp. NPDC020719]|uniref:hypothetical protein n=1 Tax=Streptomyces sp. NPDC020719 TaxID=3154896 RepID=UPI0033DD092A